MKTAIQRYLTPVFIEKIFNAVVYILAFFEDVISWN